MRDEQPHTTYHIINHEGAVFVVIEFCPASTVRHDDSGTYAAFTIVAFRVKDATEKEQVFYCFNRGLAKTMWCVDSMKLE